MTFPSCHVPDRGHRSQCNPCSWFRAIPILAAWVAGMTLEARGQDARTSRIAERHALLVGVTAYANLPESLQLKGPANDVRLMRELLVNRFGFVPDHVRVLAEGEPDGDAARPTLANIGREFRRLADAARSGDQVVILMAGHGSQQPDQDPPGSDDREPDGLDEIFLPADVGAWSGAIGQVERAISDDQLRAWLNPIRENGASLWVILDSCHSGTMVRGADQEVVRQIPPGALIPENVMESVRSITRDPETVQDRMPLARRADGAAPLVAMYAAQANEVTVEKALPSGARDKKPHGLFTYTITQVLSQANGPLTYRELVSRVQARYSQTGRTAPTPLVEGADRDREVLGSKQWPGRSRMALAKSDREWTVSAGRLQGVLEGSVLAVFPPPGRARTEKPLGYVTVIESRTFDSIVEPREYEGIATDAASLPVGGICDTVFVDCGDLRLRVAADPLDHRGHPVDAPLLESLRRKLDSMCGAEGSFVQAVDASSDADWLIRADRGGVYLVPASGVVADRGADGSALPPIYGPAPQGADETDWLKDRLNRIARVKNLVRLTGLSADAGDDAAPSPIELTLVRLRDRKDREGIAIGAEENGAVLHHDDWVELKLTNSGRDPVDATLLYIDSAFGIDCLYPRDGEDNRLRPGNSVPIRIRVDGRTAGLEHLVVIGVRAVAGPPADFSVLTQEPIERGAAIARNRGGAPVAPQSPLGKLLERAANARGTTRGVQRATLDDHVLRLHSWVIRSQPRNVGR